MSDTQLVVFELDGILYAFRITDVYEILKVPTITPLPQMPAHVEGVINLRGRVIPVVNLRSRLGLSKMTVGQDTRIILVKSQEKELGVVVDRVLEVNTYREEEMEAPETRGEGRSVLRGIVKKKEKMWLVLDLARIA